MSITALTAEISASSVFKLTSAAGQKPAASEDTKEAEPIVNALDQAAEQAKEDAVVIRELRAALEANKEDDADKSRQDYLKLGEEAQKNENNREDAVSALRGEPPAKGLTRPAFSKDDAFSFKSAEAVYSEVSGDGFTARAGTLQTASVTPNGISFSEVNISEARIETDNSVITVRTLSITEAYRGTSAPSGGLFSKAA